MCFDLRNTLRNRALRAVLWSRVLPCIKCLVRAAHLANDLNPKSAKDPVS